MSSRRSPRHPLALAVLLALASQASLADTSSVPAAAQQQRFDIPAGPLGRQLNLLASQAGILLGGNASLTANKQSQAVHGATSVEQALAQMLAGTGLGAIRSGDREFQLIERANDQALELGATQIDGKGLGAITENSGLYTTGQTSTATRLALSPRETPQAVTVVTRQQMDDQNMQSLEDVARAATGISTVKGFGTERPLYFSRGFAVDDLQFDGLPTSVSESFSMDVMSVTNMAIYDRVEIVRGANGLLQGAGNPSAAINMVRKRPTAAYQFKAELGAGSWDTYRAQVDVGGPLNEQGTLRGRTVLMYSTGNSYQDYADKENQLFYAIAEADLSDWTSVSIGTSLQRDNNGGYDWGGLPTRLDGSAFGFSRSTSLAGKWAYLDKVNRSLFADVKHEFNDDWKLTVATQVIWSTADFLAQTGYHYNSDTLMQYYPNSADYDDEQVNLDAALNGAFYLLGRRHELVLGASARRDRLQYGIGVAADNPFLDLSDFDSGSIAKPDMGDQSIRSRHVRKDKGLYLATRLNPIDDLHVILGSRFSWVDYDTAGQWETDDYHEDAKAIPYAGVVYDLTENTSVYASYTEIYKLQSNYSLQNTLLDPITGSNYEIGLKNAFYDGRLNTAVALFQVDQVGLPQELAGVPRQCGPARNARCYSEGAKVRSRGFDLEVSGELLPGWNAQVGYTYSHPEYVAGPNKGSDYGTENSPQRLFKAATSYRLPGALEQWKVGASLYHQSEIYKDVVHQGAYNLVDLNTQYQVNGNLSVQLNLNNLFDEKYYTAVFSPDLGNYYGAPRNFALTLRYQN